MQVILLSGVLMASRYWVRMLTSASRALEEWRGASGASLRQACRRLKPSTKIRTTAMGGL